MCHSTLGFVPGKDVIEGGREKERERREGGREGGREREREEGERSCYIVYIFSFPV